MTVLNYVLMAILLVCAVFLVVAVLLQKTKDEGLSGAIKGGADTFYGRDGGDRTDLMLKKWTKIVGLVFALCVLAIYVIQPDYAETAAVSSWKELTQYAAGFKA
ncbi:MAG: preprotein translocase subunit SecG [Clostridia bacterium]|nr:preprotein translocase subunit SecG [Clostridia bacterium]